MNIYYDIGRLLSYSELYKIAVGQRGNGKTFQAKLQGVKKFLKNGYQFMYVRRYKTEHKNIKKFFDDLVIENNKRIAKGKTPFFPKDTKFEVVGSWKDGSGVFKINDKVAGYWVTLSIQLTFKSTPFPLVTMLVFDEFLIKKGTYHYLAEEVSDFEDLVETVFRDRDGPEIVGAIMLSNKISWYNPYFLAWKINPFNTEFYRNKERQIVIQQCASEEFKAHKYSTRLGQHLQNTKYGNYSIENESLEELSSFVEKMPAAAKPFFNVRYMGVTYGFWLDTKENKAYFSNKFDPFCKFEFALTTSDHSLNTYYLKNKKNCQLSYFSWFYEQGRLFADSNTVDPVLQEILKIML